MIIDVTEVVLAIIGMCFVLITKHFIPWIRSKTSVKQQELIKTIAKSVVYAAQQLYDKEAVEEKKAYAMERVEAELERYGIKLSTEEIDTYIEGVLKDIKTNLTDGSEW